MKYLIILIFLCSCAQKTKKITYFDIDAKKEYYIQQYRLDNMTSSEAGELINNVEETK